jgi:hypothetical protein
MSGPEGRWEGEGAVEREERRELFLLNGKRYWVIFIAI